MAKISNPWNDEELRNGFDTARDIGLAGGLALTAVGALLPDSSADLKKGLMGGGVGLASISGLTGLLFGQEKGNVIKEKIEFLEFTRNAYDDLTLRRGMIEGYLKSNDDFLARINAFQAEYKAARTDNDKDMALVKLETVYIEFQAILRQMPEYVQAFRKAVSLFKQGVGPKPTAKQMIKLKEDLEGLDVRLVKIQERYEQRIVPILSRSTNILALIRGHGAEEE
jgi:hypothetical protein